MGKTQGLHNFTPPILPYKILIADNHPDSLALMIRYLSQDGMQVIVAKDGAAACQIVQQNPDVDLVIIDVLMPIIGGMEFMGVLQGMPSSCDIPVIIATAAATSAQTIEGLRAGALYYLHKPYTCELFMAYVYAALRLSKKLRAGRRDKAGHHQGD